ncbi:MAG: hypothetical protein ACQEV0_16270 [Bacillota bacterium]
MEKSRWPAIVGGVLGFAVGMIGGAFLGLVIGGTFLGGFDIFEITGLQGYELAAYVGALLGAIAGIIFGAKLGMRIVDNKGKTL